uniref:Uncharacterized protein n=1 Tax=Anopheles dirus TaxID=7168 RepID=A0A182NX68_9DIPT
MGVFYPKLLMHHLKGWIRTGASCVVKAMAVSNALRNMSRKDTGKCVKMFCSQRCDSVVE